MRKLETVVDLLEAMREERGWASDNQIAQGLRVGQQTVSSWRTGVRTPGDDHALKIAEALDISPALVMAIAAMERSTSKESKKIWQILAEQLARGVVPTVATLAVLAATYTGPVASVVYSVKRRRRSQEALQPA